MNGQDVDGRVLRVTSPRRTKAGAAGGAAGATKITHSCKRETKVDKNRDERESENEGRRGEKNIDYCTNNTGTQC